MRIGLMITLLSLCGTMARADDVRDDFLKLIDRPRVALDAKVIAIETTGAIEEVHFTYHADKDNIVPGVLIKSSSSTSRNPVVIALHGTGGKKEDLLPFLHKMAAKGFIGVAIDGRYHGERSKAGNGSEAYQHAIYEAWKRNDQSEHPFFFDTTWDVMRLIDYLQTREDVDPNRIGLYGISKGGIEAYLTAAADPRVTAVVPCIAMQSFDWALKNDAWKSRIGTIQTAFDAAAKDAGIAKPDAAFVKAFYDRVVPGIDGEFDGPSVIRLIAPRPLMLINGETDDRTPLPGLKLCIEAAEKAYQAQNASDQLKVLIPPKTGHTVTPAAEAAAIDWLCARLLAN